MSFSAHRRDALDASLPVNHRMSHVRSCAVHVSQKYHVHRSVIIERVRQMTGVDVTAPGSDDDIRRAMDALTLIKNSGLPDADKRNRESDSISN